MSGDPFFSKEPSPEWAKAMDGIECPTFEAVLVEPDGAQAMTLQEAAEWMDAEIFRPTMERILGQQNEKNEPIA